LSTKQSKKNWTQLKVLKLWKFIKKKKKKIQRFLTFVLGCFSSHTSPNCPSDLSTILTLPFDQTLNCFQYVSYLSNLETTQKNVLLQLTLSKYTIETMCLTNTAVERCSYCSSLFIDVSLMSSLHLVIHRNNLNTDDLLSQN